ncbi:FMN-binding negative transcriptional regulator [Gangjinia marincola]|uniref:FMN-binding negative transcriptional regulator n=1 Tax=Gangjinia marincola TaxID=578463 RepID=A0ABP3XZ18_9FLAO
MNKYPPPHHQEQNPENIIKVIQHYPLGTLVTAKDDEAHITHIPLIYEADDSKYGKLVAHIDKFNPQVNHLINDSSATAVFHGPQTYISPSILSTTQLPTWNYIIVHVKGKIHLLKDRDQVRETLIRMTSFLEGDNPAYVLAENNPRMEAALDYIIGFEIEITSWEGKFKFSQDKAKRDKALAKAELIQSQQNSVRAFIDDLFDHHHQIITK